MRFLHVICLFGAILGALAAGAPVPQSGTALQTVPEIVQTAARHFQLRVKPGEKKECVYDAGEPMFFCVELTGDRDIPKDWQIRCSFSDARGRLQEGQSYPASSAPLWLKTVLDKPGWVWMKAELLDGRGNPVPDAETPITASMGSVACVEKIVPGGKFPTDFEAFWKKNLQLVSEPFSKVSCSPVEFGDDKDRQYLCFDVRIACDGLAAPVSGYLVMPRNAKEKSLPAIVSFQGAGVYSAGKKVYGNAISFQINAHGVPNGKPREYYRELRATILRDYPHRNRTDRDCCYFRDMFVRAVLATQYVCTLPEWDGTNLVALGTSQGGAQSLVAAALNPRVTLCIACVPAMCDHGGELQGRRSGWPGFVPQKDHAQYAKICEVANYYDVANFARLIRCPVYISAGLIDCVCVPTSVIAAYASLPNGVEKHLSLLPSEGHVSTHPYADAALQRLLSPGK